MSLIKSILKTFKHIVSKCINIFVPRKNNKIYARYMFNSIHDKYDLLNCSSSNLLCLLNDIVNNNNKKQIEIFVEYYDASREQDYISLQNRAKDNNVLLKMNPSWKSKKGLKRITTRIYCLLARFSSTVWLTESGDDHLYGKLKSQKEICCGYYISCKSDFMEGLERRWSRLDAIITTALLPSNILSSHTGVRLDRCLPLGFPRNDTIGKSKNKDVVNKWIEKEVGHTPKHIFVYAPTVRDEDNFEDTKEDKPLFGYKTEKLPQLLKELDAVMIYKLHPYQNVETIKNTECFLEYPKQYEFSFYDVLSVAGCLIGDYSSVNFDYLLLDKPIIFNLYDLEKYKKLRGLSYDPYEYFCPGDISTDWETLKESITNVSKGIDEYKERRKEVRKLLFKYPDFDSTERVREYILSQL